MSVYGTHYAINDRPITAPDEEAWGNFVPGEGLDGLQRRSPYRQLEWRKRVGGECDVEDWFEFDNTVLTALTTRLPGYANESERYTDAICPSVTGRHQHGALVEVIAVFVVNTG